MQCEYHNTCGFLEQTSRIDPFSVHSVEIIYCNNDKLACLRYCLHQVLEEDLIPDHLWPNDEAGAEEIERAHGKKLSIRFPL